MDKLVDFFTGNKAQAVMDELTRYVIILAILYFGYHILKGVF